MNSVLRRVSAPAEGIYCKHTIRIAAMLKIAKTYVAKPGELKAKWFLVDVTDKVVGRVASDIAMILMGKHRPTYTAHIDTGDFVIVTNAEKIIFSDPNKWDEKEYTWY